MKDLEINMTLKDKKGIYTWNGHWLNIPNCFISMRLSSPLSSVPFPGVLGFTASSYWALGLPVYYEHALNLQDKKKYIIISRCFWRENHNVSTTWQSSSKHILIYKNTNSKKLKLSSSGNYNYINSVAPHNKYSKQNQ